MSRFSRRRFTLGLGRALALGGGAVLVGRPRQARAAQAEAEVRLSATKVRVGDRVRLTMIVGVRNGRAPARIPWPDALAGNFEVSSTASLGSSSGGRMGEPVVSTRKVSATITPLVIGKFKLGFAMTVGGEAIESNAPVLEVVGADEALPEPPAGSGPTEPQGEVFMWADVDKPSVYVGQQLTYNLDIYERRSFFGIHLRKPPSFTDFFTEELSEGEPMVKNVGGVPYRVRPGLRRALFPQRAGELEIGAAELSVGGFQRILSPALTVEVKPLPAEGRPAGMSPNNVGRYTIKAEIDRDRLAASEPATLRVTIEGEGNIKFIDPGPWPEIEGVRRYDPKVETRVRKGDPLGGRRQYEFLLIPERGGTLTIPPHELSFFDPVAERYEIQRTEALELVVQGDEAAAPAPEAPAAPEGEVLAEIVTGGTLPRHVPRERWLNPERWLYGMLAVPVVAATGLGGAALWRRYGPDEKAQARARRRLRHRGLVEVAERAIEGGEGFYATLTKLLQEIAVERAGTEGVGLPRPELLRLLGQSGVPTEDIERLRDLLDRCDAARFGAQGDDGREERQSLFDEVLDLVRNRRLGKEAP